MAPRSSTLGWLRHLGTRHPGVSTTCSSPTSFYCPVTPALPIPPTSSQPGCDQNSSRARVASAGPTDWGFLEAGPWACPLDVPRSGLQGPDGAEGVGLPSFSSCPHVLEVTVQLDPGLRTRVPGQGPASSWGLDLGAPFLSISYSRATPTAGVRVRVTAAHAGLRGLTQAWCWSGADSPAPELTKL